MVPASRSDIPSMDDLSSRMGRHPAQTSEGPVVEQPLASIAISSNAILDLVANIVPLQCCLELSGPRLGESLIDCHGPPAKKSGDEGQRHQTPDLPAKRDHLTPSAHFFRRSRMIHRAASTTTPARAIAMIWAYPSSAPTAAIPAPAPDAICTAEACTVVD